MRFSIRSKLIVSVGLALLVIYGGVVGVDAYRSRGVARDRIRRHLRNQARATATRLEYALRGVTRTADQLSDYVATNENVPREFYWLILRKALERNRGIVAACVAFEPAAGPGEVYSFAPLAERQPPREEAEDLYPRFRMNVSPAESMRSERRDYFNANWYRQAVLAEKGVWSEPYYDDGGRLVCTFAEPMYRDGELLGVAAVDVQIEWLRKIIDRHRQPEETTLLLSRNGRFLHHPQEQYVMSETLGGTDESIPWFSLAKAMTSGEEQARRLRTPRGPVWAVYTPVPSSNWSFAVILPEVKMMRSLRQYLRGEAAVLLAAFGLVMLTLLVVSFFLTRRLKRITRTIRQVEAGAPCPRVPGRLGRDEIGDVARALNRMMDRRREKEPCRRESEGGNGEEKKPKFPTGGTNEPDSGMMPQPPV